MSGGAGGYGGTRGGSGGFMNQFISPGAAGMGPNQYGTGMLNGGPQANFNGMNMGNKNPYKGGTTSKQMQDNVLRYWRDQQAAEGQLGPMSGSVLGTDMDPRRSPDVAMPWRVGQGTLPYNGPVNGGTPMPPNPTGAPNMNLPSGFGASPGNGGTPMQPNQIGAPNMNLPSGFGASPGNYDPAAYASSGATIPYRTPRGAGPNMSPGGIQTFDERAPTNYSGLLGRGSSYR